MNPRKSAAQRRQLGIPETGLQSWARRRALTLSGRPAVSSEDTDHRARRAVTDEEVV